MDTATKHHKVLIYSTESVILSPVINYVNIGVLVLYSGNRLLTAIVRIYLHTNTRTCTYNQGMNMFISWVHVFFRYYVTLTIYGELKEKIYGKNVLNFLNIAIETI